MYFKTYNGSQFKLFILITHYLVPVNPFSEDFLELKCINYALYGSCVLNSIDLLMFVKATAVVASTSQLKLTKKIGKMRQIQVQ